MEKATILTKQKIVEMTITNLNENVEATWFIPQ